MLNIVVLDGHTLNPGDLDWSPLQSLGETTIYSHTTPEEIFERAIDADVLVVNKVVLTREMIAKLDKLKYVAVTATGYNNIDTAALRERGIPASNIRNYGTDAVAQHTIALLLELCNHVGQHHRAVLDGQWGRTTGFCFWNSPIRELAGKTMGIVGWGNIGQRVADIAVALGMKVIFYSSRKISSGIARQTDMETLFSTADVISLHTHLSDQNTAFVNSSLLSLMKPTAYLLNTSRGALVNENDLYEALETGRIGGAGLDVLSVEPPAEGNILIGARNCIITPHNAWASREARQRMMDMLVENILSWREGRAINVV